MNPLENFRIAARALRVNKLRSTLTVLGIVIGVAAVVCMVSVGAGAQVDVLEKIRTLGANLLMITPGAQNSGGARLGSGTPAHLDGGRHSRDPARAQRCAGGGAAALAFHAAGRRQQELGRVRGRHQS